MVEAPQVIHAAHFLIGGVIHTAEVGQPVELELGVEQDELGDLAPVGRVDVDARVLVLGE